MVSRFPRRDPGARGHFQIGGRGGPPEGRGEGSLRSQDHPRSPSEASTTPRKAQGNSVGGCSPSRASQTRWERAACGSSPGPGAPALGDGTRSATSFALRPHATVGEPGGVHPPSSSGAGGSLSPGQASRYPSRPHPSQRPRGASRTAQGRGGRSCATSSGGARVSPPPDTSRPRDQTRGHNPAQPFPSKTRRPHGLHHLRRGFGATALTPREKSGGRVGAKTGHHPSCVDRGHRPHHRRRLPRKDQHRAGLPRAHGARRHRHSLRSGPPRGRGVAAQAIQSHGPGGQRRRGGRPLRGLPSGDHPVPPDHPLGGLRPRSPRHGFGGGPLPDRA